MQEAVLVSKLKFESALSDLYPPALLLLVATVARS